MEEILHRFLRLTVVTKISRSQIVVMDDPFLPTTNQSCVLMTTSLEGITHALDHYLLLSRRAKAWKTLVAALTTLVPIGLFLAALPPNYVTVSNSTS
jgi:hypothetical protein